MRVYKKDLFIGSKVLFNINNKKNHLKNKKYTIKKIYTNVIFIQTDENTYIDLYEFAHCSLPRSLAKKFVTQYKTHPVKDGDICAANLKPYFNSKKHNLDDKIELNNILNDSKTL